MSDKKRRRDEAEPPKIPRNKSLGNEDDEDVDIDCEDPFEDEIEEEVIVQDDDDVDDAMEEDEDEGPTKVWRPNVDQLEEGETLDYDSNAYDLFHVLNADWPCLSLDIVADNLGYKRTAVCFNLSKNHEILRKFVKLDFMFIISTQVFK